MLTYCLPAEFQAPSLSVALPNASYLFHHSAYQPLLNTFCMHMCKTFLLPHVPSPFLTSSHPLYTLLPDILAAASMPTQARAENYNIRGGSEKEKMQVVFSTG